MEWKVGPQKRGYGRARDERFGLNQLEIGPKTVGDGKFVPKVGKVGGWP